MIQTARTAYARELQGELSNTETLLYRTLGTFKGSVNRWLQVSVDGVYVEECLLSAARTMVNITHWLIGAIV